MGNNKSLTAAINDIRRDKQEHEYQIYFLSDNESATNENNWIDCKTIDFKKEIDENTVVPEKTFFLRGNGDDMEMQKAIRKLWKQENGQQVNASGRVKSYNDFRALMFSVRKKDKKKHTFFLTPVVPHEGDTIQKRLAMAIHLIEFCHKLLKTKRYVRVAILSGCRKEWCNQSELIDRVYFEGMMLRENIKRRFEKVEFFADKAKTTDLDDEGKTIDVFDLEDTMLWADIVMTQDGISGNQYARLLNFETEKYKIEGIPWFVPASGSQSPRGEGSFLKDHVIHQGRPLPYHEANIQAWQNLLKSGKFDIS